jgi:NADH-quinone oxidoreductase subunit F
MEVLDAIKRQIAGSGASAAAELRCDASGCNGQCERGPVVEISPYGWVYHKVRPADAPRIVDYALEGDPASPTADKNPYSAGQEKRVLRRMGRTSPMSVEDYIGSGGFTALERALTELSPDELCAMITASGLRGRGGGGS